MPEAFWTLDESPLAAPFGRRNTPLTDKSKADHGEQGLQAALKLEAPRNL